MKYIGIVSRIHGINYGANLQAIALQKAIESIGGKVEYINYVVEVPSKGLKRILSWGYGLVRQFLGFRKRLERTNIFRDAYLNLSPELDSKNIRSYARRYDLLLAGSDQIWNPRYFFSSNGLYLLSFGNDCPKASYSSSFGVTSLPVNLKNCYREELRKFQKLSVREGVGTQILEQMGIRNAEVHIDPTLLLDSEQWKTFFDREPIVRVPYICCYVMSGATALNNYILRQAEVLQKKIKGCPQIIILGEKEYKGFFSKHVYVRTAGPKEFLNYIYNAQYVLTSSFHGTCFSILFKKNFFSILSKENKFNSRIEHLLGVLLLKNCIHYQEDNIDIEDSICDYSVAYRILGDERNRSMEFLRDIVTQ